MEMVTAFISVGLDGYYDESEITTLFNQDVEYEQFSSKETPRGIYTRWKLCSLESGSVDDALEWIANQAAKISPHFIENDRHVHKKASISHFFGDGKSCFILAGSSLDKLSKSGFAIELCSYSIDV